MRLLLILILCLSSAIYVNDILIKNARIFNGVDEQLTFGHILIKDGLIDSIFDTLPQTSSSTQIIDAQNRELSPELIDIHTHFDEQYPL